MQVWKKVLSTLLALALLLSCCPAITLTASAAEVDGELIATITFGANGSASHYDGTKLSSSKSYTEGEYTLALTNCTNIYGGARDAKGNSVLKFGASSSAGSLTFSVADDVIAVVLRLAKYKSNTSKCTINGTAYTLTKNSNDGNYDEIVVDTTATKSITIKTVSGGYRMMMDSVSFYKAASAEPEEPEETTAPTEETTAPTEETTAPTEPEETIPPEIPEGRLAIFEFGENTAGGHKDSTTAMTSGAVSFTDNGYTITFNDCASVYDKCNDEKGNSAIKFGTGSKSGSLTFTVADDVDYIVIKLAKYKANASKYSINGGEAVSLNKSSNDGEYEEVVVDTSTNKTVTIATVSGGLRMMMDSVAFYSNAGGTIPEPPATEPADGVYNFEPNQDVTIALDTTEPITTLSFIYTITESGAMNLALMNSDLSAYYGYFAFDKYGTVDTYDGVTVEQIGDKTCRATLDIAALTKYTGNPAGEVVSIYVRGTWTDATGTIYDIKINGGEPAEPEADTELSIAKAIELGLAKEHDVFTDNKYYVTGVITEVYNTTYGNMKITDGNGNILTVYGTYSSNGEIRYDAMAEKPEVGDTVKLYGVIGQYNGTPQIKNAWLKEHIPAPAATVVLTPSKTEVKRGESFDIVVSVTEADAYTSMGFEPAKQDSLFVITYGETLEIVNSQAVMKDCNTIDGAFNLSAAKEFTGEMFRFTMTVNEDAAFGAMTLTGTAVLKNGTQPLKVTLANAKVTVICEHETLDNYQAVDAETHQGTCAACGEAVTVAHSFGGWAELDQNEHGVVCWDCDYMQTEAHIFEDGLCNDCGCMEEYTVVFKNYDGSILHEETYYYADMIIEPEITPAKPADEAYSYVFAGWTPEFEEVTGDAEYVAVYEAVYVEYTVTFLDRNGAVLQTGVYHYGDPVTAPEAPAGYHDSKNLYTFSQWNKAVTEVTGNAVYTAQYEISGIRGDFDGDGKLSDRDAIYLLRCTLGMPNYELTQSGDVDGDGQTTDADVVYMLRHILFANRYPLY